MFIVHCENCRKKCLRWLINVVLLFPVKERNNEHQRQMTLISIDSIQYKRRLVRVLNNEHWFNGFYTPCEGESIRCNRARLKGGEIEVREIGEGWFRPTTQQFYCPNSGEILASIVA